MPSIPERRSRVHYKRAEKGQGEYPEVVYFEGSPPPTLEASGLYVGFRDFIDVSHELRVQNVPLTTLYHTLVLHFAEKQPDLHKLAYEQLRYNPNNHSYWNEYATTYRYSLLGSALVPYAVRRTTPETKINGVGLVGRRVLRAVLFEEFPGELSVDNPEA